MTRSADDAARLRLLASAIAGRPVEVAAGAAGAPAWTDGATVFVDMVSEPADRIRALAVQASLLGAGSLHDDVLRPLARRPAAARRYLSLEGHRALAGRRHLLPPTVWPLLDDAIAASSASPAESLDRALGHAPVPDPPDVFGAIHPRRVVAAAPGGGRDEAARHVPCRDAQAAPRVLEDEEEDEPAPGIDLLSSPVGGGGGLGRLLKKMLGEGRAPGTGPPGADAPTHASRRASRTAGREAVSSTIARIPDAAAPFAPRGYRYPEWDDGRRRYRPGWCTVVEVAPADLAPLAVPDTHRLRRALGRLGTELERRHRQLQGDDIDVDAAVEARVEALAGSTPDEAVYIDNVRGRRDLSVLLLLDVSGSAGLRSSTGPAVHEHQRAAAAALAASLHGLGDRVALYAFRSQGRSAVQLLPVKRFADDMDARVSGRLGGLAPGAYTRLGAAIRHGAAVLDRDGGTARRLLVVLSDGLAYDHGYESAHGEADARRALAEARRQGIGCLCLSIGAGADTGALRRVFGTAAHASVPHPERLPAVVGPLLRAALASADLRRRAWQRRERTKERLVVERRTA